MDKLGLLSKCIFSRLLLLTCASLGPKCSRDACISRMPFNSWMSGTSYKVSIALYFTKGF